MTISSYAQKHASFEHRNDSLVIEHWIERSKEFRKKDLDSALFYAKKAHRKSKEAKIPSLKYEATNQIGIDHRYLGNLDSALFYYEEALKLAIQEEDSFLMAKSWHNLAVVYRKQGALEKALEQELKSIPIIERFNDTLSMGYIYNSLGNIYNVQENWEKAIAYYSKGLALQQSLKNPSAETRLYYNLGNTYYMMGDNAKADSMLQISLQIAKDIQQNTFIANAYHSLGVVQQSLNHTDLAQSYFREAAELFELMGDTEGLMFIQMSLGEIYDMEQQWALAEREYRKALSTALEIGMKEEALAAQNRLANSLEKQGKFKAALAQLKQHNLLKDSLREENNSQRILELQEKYETDKKEKENLLLQQENQLKASELATKNQGILIRNLVLAVLAIVLILAIFILLNYRKRIRVQRLISLQKEEMNRKKMMGLIREQELQYVNATLIGQESERNRIATDLHDGLSNMMVTVKLYFENLADQLKGEDEAVIQKYGEAIQMLDKLCKKARSLAHELSDQPSRFNFKSALVEMVAIINKTGQLKVELSIFGLDKPYGASFENGIFNILRELIGNCLKHAKANQLFIQLTDHGDQLSIIIEDDGEGFELEKVRNKGLGIVNLQNRIRTMDGQIDIDSVIGRGTSVTIELPTKLKSNEPND